MIENARKLDKSKNDSGLAISGPSKKNDTQIIALVVQTYRHRGEQP